jgi:hypothetical protein
MALLHQTDSVDAIDTTMQTMQRCSNLLFLPSECAPLALLPYESP